MLVWMLIGGAVVVDGNESFSIGGANDWCSLRLFAGVIVTSLVVCIFAGSLMLRLLACNGGLLLVWLMVLVVVCDCAGCICMFAIVTFGAGDWAFIVLLFVMFNVVVLVALLLVAFEFGVMGLDWVIDDVYFDLYGKG